MNRFDFCVVSASILMCLAGYHRSADNLQSQFPHQQSITSPKKGGQRFLASASHPESGIAASLQGADRQDPEQDPKKDTQKSEPETETERNQRLEKYLSGTRWTGRFTFSGQGDKPPAEEKYEIIEAKKAETGDDWNLVARIQYGGKDVTLPLPTLQIKWAGETPVITVDKMVIPGMGTFDARVLIRKGQYAGTWAHGEVGGHMFGSIERLEDSDEKKSDD